MGPKQLIGFVALWSHMLELLSGVSFPLKDPYQDAETPAPAVHGVVTCRYQDHQGTTAVLGL